MRNRFDQFLLFDSVFDRSAKMKSQLVRAVQRNQRGDCYQTAITFRQFLPVLDIAEKDFIGELNQLRGEIAKHPLGS